MKRAAPTRGEVRYGSNVHVREQGMAPIIGKSAGSEKQEAYNLIRGLDERWGKAPLFAEFRAINSELHRQQLSLQNSGQPAPRMVSQKENLPWLDNLLRHRLHRTTTGYAPMADDHFVETAERVVPR